MDKLRIGNLIDLSLVEIITLNVLIEYGKPIVRYTLYEIVNQFIQSNKLNTTKLENTKLKKYERKFFSYLQKKEQNNSNLSTSSFYNNLSNLEERGLVEFHLNHKGRVKKVETTKLANSLLKYLLQFFMDSSVIPDFIKFDEGLTDRIKKISNKEHLENIMAVWFSEHIFLRLINFFKALANEVFILSEKESYGNYTKTDLKDVHISKLYKKKIREPNDIIEMIAIPTYKKNIDFFGMNRVEVLKELHRVLQPGGMIIIVTKASFPFTEDEAADVLLKIYKESISDTIFTEEELKQDLEAAGFSKNKLFEYRGCIIGIGWAE
jgi:DNA-binding PadR family transcriptional regulator